MSVWNPFFVKEIKLLAEFKKLKEVKNLPYETRLKKLELTTLEQRRCRGDLLQMYKIIFGLEEVRLLKGLNFAESDHFTRGNFLKLRQEIFKNCTFYQKVFNFMIN